jgi:pseudaminic acid cytidylyltransferase
MISQLSDEKLAKALMEMPDGKRANVLGLIK